MQKKDLPFDRTKHGMRLIREHTEAEGFPNCDFWYLMENDAEN